IADDLHQHSLLPSAIKFAIKDLFPRPKVQLTFGDGNDDLATHHLALNVSVSVVFAGLIVMIAGHGFMWRELFQPGFIILMQSAFVVINEDRRSYMHGIHQHQPFDYGALTQALLNLLSYVNERTTSGNIEPKFFAITLHQRLLRS